MVSETLLVIKILEVVKWNRVFKESKEQEHFFKSTKKRQKWQKYQQIEKWNEDFMESLMEEQKEDPKEKRKGHIIFNSNQGRIENSALSC